MKRYLSILSLMLVGIIYLVSFLRYEMYNRGSMLNGGDAGGYYFYLPALLIHNDIDHLRYTVYHRDVNAENYADSTKPVSIGEAYYAGNVPVLKYTIGIAILETPAFLAAHLVSKVTGMPADGYSYYYMLFIHFNNLLFIFIGLLLLRRLLLHYFNHIVVALVIFTIGVGTNLYHFTVHNIGMSHGYLFMLYVALMYGTVWFYKRYDVLSGIVIGLSAGMITLIRPNEVICLLIPLAYGITSLTCIKDRVVLLVKQKPLYIAMALFICCGLCQVIYWKMVTGHFVHYSYGTESFDFLHSKIGSGVFGYKNGWLPYAPAMIFALAGIPFLFLKLRQWALPVITLVPLHIYIIYSWWCWNYINGLGSRPMIEMYAILALPMGLFFTWVLRYRYVSIIIYASIILFAAQQMFMTWQRDRNILWSEESNSVFYWGTLFKTEMDMNDVIEFDTGEDQPEGLKHHHTIYVNTFEDSLNTNYIHNKGCVTGKYGFLLNNAISYSPAFESPLKNCNVKPADWVKVSMDVCNLPPSAALGRHADMAIELKRNGKDYKRKSIRIQNKVQNRRPYGIWIFECDESGKVYFYTQIPETAQPDDIIKIYGMNYSDAPVVLDNFMVEVYK